jgi:hypothetical protein
MLAVVVAAIGAGAVNAVVGSGTLLTFPTLIAVGLPPVTANVSNTVGLVLGSFSAVAGYREELSGQRRRLGVLSVASVTGAVIGGILLLVLPQEAFRAVVPVLIGLGCVLVVAQPWLAERVTRPHDAPAHGGPWLVAGVLGSGIYGGYFGAAQGVLLIAVLGLALDEHLQRINAAKNLLAALVNLSAAVLFIVVADVAWDAAALVAAGSIVGAFTGARFGRRLRPAVLRGLVVLVGLVAIVALVAG